MVSKYSLLQQLMAYPLSSALYLEVKQI